MSETAPPQRFEWQFCRFDGTEFMAEVSLNRLKIHGEIFVQAFVRDISQQKEIQQALLNSKQTLETILDSLPFGIMVVNKEKVIININESATKMFGHSSGKLLKGRKCFETICPAQKGKMPRIGSWAESRYIRKNTYYCRRKTNTNSQKCNPGYR